MAATEQTTARGAFDEISGFERELQRLVTRDDAPAGMSSLRERAAETRDRLLELSQEEIQLELSDELRTELLQYCLAALHKLNRAAQTQGDAEAALRQAAEALVDLEALRHILRDAVDHEPLRTLELGRHTALSRADAVRHVEQWLPRLTADERGALLGTDARSLRRWREDETTPATRHAELALEIAAVLRHSWTDEGVLRWFSREHPMLQGRRPDDVIDDVDWEPALRDAARAARAMTAT